MNKLLLIFIIVLLTSCYREELLDIKQAGTSEQLILHSLISPDTDSIYVSLGVTNGNLKVLFDTAFVLPEAVVTFSDGNNQIILHKIKTKPALYGCSQLEFPIVEGNTYSISASVSGYNTITGSTTVPGNRSCWQSPDTPRYYIEHFANNSDHYSYSFSAQWESSEDNLGHNYFSYRTGGIRYLLKNSPGDSVGYRGFHQQVIDSSLFQSGLSDPEKLEMVQITGDQQFNFLFSTTIPEDFASEDCSNEESNIECMNIPSGKVYHYLTFYIITTDKHFSAYLGQPEIPEQYPFSSFSGIFPHYSSISGGYGLLGSYLIDSVYFDVYHPVNFFEPTQNPDHAQ